MKPQFASIFLIAGALVLGSPLASAATSSNGIFLNTSADGSTELSNLSGESGEELAIAVPEGANPPATTGGNTFLSTPRIPQMMAPNSGNTGSAAASQSVESSDAPQLSSNEQYRNHIQQQMHGSLRNAANPAVSRRYLMQSRPPLAAMGR
ncbi:MAG: hypothetical protein WAV95_13545 [Azonexus sp.]